MKCKIEINMDNDAFGNHPCSIGEELGRILRTLGKDIAIVHGGMKEGIRDINGNTVGSIRILD
jgi:hypothetical protein